MAAQDPPPNQSAPTLRVTSMESLFRVWYTPFSRRTCRNRWAGALWPVISPRLASWETRSSAAAGLMPWPSTQVAPASNHLPRLSCQAPSLASDHSNGTA